MFELGTAVFNGFQWDVAIIATIVIMISSVIIIVVVNGVSIITMAPPLWLDSEVMKLSPVCQHQCTPAD